MLPWQGQWKRRGFRVAAVGLRHHQDDRRAVSLPLVAGGGDGGDDAVDGPELSGDGDRVGTVDQDLERGDGAGHDGGRIVFAGTPADLVAARSTLTGKHLAAYVGT
jgi:hypothetical protein